MSSFFANFSKIVILKVQTLIVNKKHPESCVVRNKWLEPEDGDLIVTIFWFSDATMQRNALTRNRKHRRAAAKPAACAKPLML